MDEDSSTEHKTWQAYSFGKRNVFRLHLTESREGFCRNARWRWTESREGAGTNSGESGAKNLQAETVPETEQRVREGV